MKWLRDLVSSLMPAFSLKDMLAPIKEHGLSTVLTLVLLGFIAWKVVIPALDKQEAMVNSLIETNHTNASELRNMSGYLREIRDALKNP